MARPKSLEEKDESRFVLRIPSDLRKKLSAIAARHRRSLNAQILIAIEYQIEREQPDPSAPSLASR